MVKLLFALQRAIEKIFTIAIYLLMCFSGSSCKQSQVVSQPVHESNSKAWIYDHNNNTAVKSMVSSGITLLESVKEWPLKPIVSIFLFLCAFIASRYAWKKIELKIEIEPGKTKHLRSLRAFRMYLQFPKWSPTCVLCFWFVSLFLLGDQFVNIIWPNPPNGNISDYLTITIASTAVLFPLVILIMAGYQNDRPGVFSSSEVLLRYAYAFPICVMLLSILALSAFRMNYYWMRLTAAASVILSAIALLRLLNVIFVPKAWRKTEEKLLKTQARDAIAEIAHQRAGMIRTIGKLKQLEPYVANTFWTINKNGFTEQQIKAGKIGRLNRIDVDVLNSIKDKLSPRVEIASKQVEGTAPKVDSPPNAPRYQILIRVNEGEIIDRPDAVIASFRFKADLFQNEHDVKKTLSKISSAISIDKQVETDLSIEQLDMLLSRIRQLGKEAIETDNEVLADSIADSYRILVESILEAFDGLGIKYSLKTSKQESPIYGKDWKPLTRMFENLGDWTERLYKANDPSRALRSIIIFTPYHLAVTAFMMRDIYTFNNAIKGALHQQLCNTKAQIDSAEWLKWLAYQLGGELETKSSNESEQNAILDYLRVMFDVFLNLTKNAIDYGVEESFKQAMQLLQNYPKLYEFENIETNIQTKESYLRIASGDVKAVIESELFELRGNYEIIQMVDSWRCELYVGLATYCLLQLDGLGNRNKRPPQEYLNARFKELLGLLPKTFTEVIKLRIRMNRLDSSDRWGWELWEHIPLDKAVYTFSRKFEDQVFGYLLLRAAQSGFEGVKCDDLNLLEYDLLDFRKDPQALRGQLLELNKNMGIIGLEPCTPAEIEKMENCFDEIQATAKLHSELKRVRSPISNKVVSEFKSSFEQTFLRRNRLRNALRTRINSDSNSVGRPKWGINILVQREAFIDEPEMGSLDLGNHYGSELGQSEEELILNELMVKAEIIQAKNASDMIVAALDKGFKPDTIILLTARDIYSMKAIHSDPSFKYEYQVKQNKYQYKCDGFIEVRGIQVPVLSVYIRGTISETLPNILVVDTTQIGLKISTNPDDIEILPKTGFKLTLIDPLGDAAENVKFKEDLLKQNPDWLKDDPSQHREELVGKYIWFRLLEDIAIDISRKPLGMKAIVED